MGNNSIYGMGALFILIGIVSMTPLMGQSPVSIFLGAACIAGGLLLIVVGWRLSPAEPSS